MSYRCGLCNGHVPKGNHEIKLVTKVRKVTFRNRDERFPDKTATGMETVEGLRICSECSKRYDKDFVPQVVSEVSKDVWMTRRKKTEEEMKKRRRSSSWHDDEY